MRSDLTSRIFEVQQESEKHNMALISMGTHFISIFYIHFALFSQARDVPYFLPPDAVSSPGTDCNILPAQPAVDKVEESDVRECNARADAPRRRARGWTATFPIRLKDYH